MPSIKGTASLSSSSALEKALRVTPFPAHFGLHVDLSKVHRGVLRHWIEERIAQLLGFEDEIVSSTAVHLFLPEDGGANVNNAIVDPRRGQLDLAGFLGESESAQFASELWSLMLDAQTRPSGLPKQLVDKKKHELHQHTVRKVGVAGGDGEMNAIVREAARRAEVARAALAAALANGTNNSNHGNNHDNHDNNNNNSNNNNNNHDNNIINNNNNHDNRDSAYSHGLDEFGRRREAISQPNQDTHCQTVHYHHPDNQQKQQHPTPKKSPKQHQPKTHASPSQSPSHSSSQSFSSQGSYYSSSSSNHHKQQPSKTTSHSATKYKKQSAEKHVSRHDSHKYSEGASEDRNHQKGTSSTRSHEKKKRHHSYSQSPSEESFSSNEGRHHHYSSEKSRYHQERLERRGRRKSGDGELKRRR